MQIKNQCIVKGVAYFDGVIDGQPIKTGSVFVEEEMDDSKGNAKGFRTVEHKTSDAEVIKRIIHNDFPAKCELLFDLVVTKGGQKFTVSDIKPIERVAGMPKV